MHLLGRVLAVAGHRLGQVRGQHHGVLPGQPRQLLDPSLERDVGVEVDGVVEATVEQRRQQPRLERGGELDQLVGRRTISLETAGGDADLVDHHHLGARHLGRGGRVVHQQQVERAVRMVLAVGVDEHARLRQVVAGDDRAGVHCLSHRRVPREVLDVPRTLRVMSEDPRSSGAAADDAAADLALLRARVTELEQRLDNARLDALAQHLDQLTRDVVNDIGVLKADVAAMRERVDYIDTHLTARPFVSDRSAITVTDGLGRETMGFRETRRRQASGATPIRGAVPWHSRADPGPTAPVRRPCVAGGP